MFDFILFKSHFSQTKKTTKTQQDTTNQYNNTIMCKFSKNFLNYKRITIKKLKNKKNVSKKQLKHPKNNSTPHLINSITPPYIQHTINIL